MCVAHFSALLNWRLLLSNDLLLKVAHRVAFLVVSLRLLRTAVSSTVLHSVFQTVWSTYSTVCDPDCCIIYCITFGIPDCLEYSDCLRWFQR